MELVIGVIGFLLIAAGLLVALQELLECRERIQKLTSSLRERKLEQLLKEVRLLEEEEFERRLEEARERNR